VSELLQAVYRGDQARVDELLAADPELDVFEAAAVGRADRLRYLLDEDPSLANAWAEDGFQPLGLASFFGQAEAARLLVERGAEVNSASRNDQRVMPLHSAAATGDPETRYELAKLLLEHGADPNARQQDDFTPLMAAEQNGDERLRLLLIEHGAEASS
jgi:ankyrin repeat protein